jgi:dephospho-CoA kinase
MIMKIAIAGKMGSGKSLLAKQFIEKYNFKHVSFAYGVKKVAMDVFGLNEEEAFGEKKDRVLLQKIGNTMRQVDDMVWIKLALRESNVDNVVIDDVRYKNEYQALKDAGFIMVKVMAPESTRQNRLGDKFANPEHISEVDLDDIPDAEWDALIFNNASRDTLISYADKIYESFTEEVKLGLDLDNV